jgi:N-hydroxyarylamine O-acetyltransferase
MKVDTYLDRIGFAGDPRVNFETLRRVHRLHLEAIPYENLDVQLGRELGFDSGAHFRKLIASKRGGWCYEMNGVLAQALETIGFRVTRLAGAVTRDKNGDATIGSHLALCVELDQLYLADVGFGDGIIEPTPLSEGPFRQDQFDYKLEKLDERWWRFHNQPHGGAPTFDFQVMEASPAQLEERCRWLQTAPESGFVQNAVCQRYIDGELRILRGRVFKCIRGEDVQQRLIDSAEDYRRTLADAFAIELPQYEYVWDKVNARHTAWSKARSSGAL